MKQTDKLHQEKMRHSCEHVLTMAMLRLWPGKVKAAMGPATNEGFYFDFDADLTISHDHFGKIEKEMAKIIKENLPIIKDQMSVKEARDFFNKGTYQGNEYKHEWIDDIEARGEEISVYWMGEKGLDIPQTFVDICSGPHLESTGQIGAFKLTKVAGAYWHGDEKNKMLQRIYGVVFDSKEELTNYLHRQEEAKKRDHRKVGKDLDLFTFADLVGKGLPLWTEHGATIRRELERFIVDEEIKRGYIHVTTPELAKVDLYRTSGHYPYYKKDMYPPMIIDDEELILRPMTCPHHFMLYKDKPRSYRDLPMRIAELARLYRYEQSGELSGLQRVRSFCLADSHIVCRPDQVKDEIKGVLNLIEFVAGTLGLKHGENYWFRLSLGDRNNETKYYKADEKWEYAENVLRETLKEIGTEFVEAENEAAFYGPKIDIQMKNVNGKEDTAFTVQYDFCMPDRFDLLYTNEVGEDERAVVVHRSSIGAIERVVAFLIEHYGGDFPVWLAPEQVRLLAVSDKHVEFVQKLGNEFKEAGIRVGLDISDNTVGKKIREADKMKIPYLLVVGDKEKDSGLLAVRKRHQQETEKIGVKDFIDQVKKEIQEKTL